MATHTVTVELPEHYYQEFQCRAAIAGRTIEEELLATVEWALSLPIMPRVDEHLRRVDASMDLDELSDEEAARLVSEGRRRACA